MADLLQPGDLVILKGPNFAHFVTLDPDGTPQSTPLWIDADDEGNVLVNTAVGRRKDGNVKRDPRVAISVHKQDDPYTWVSVQGRVIEMREGPQAEEHIDFLNRKYHDGERWTYVEGQRRVLYVIRPDRVTRSG
jgi:PPOX class probable F420-dependent enzyme